MATIKILSVDDEAPLELLMKQYFRRKIRSGEYEFFFAHNGLEALAILYNNPDIEIILSDINMPEMDGLTLLAKVNEMRNTALRVIMVSAYGDMKNIRQAMNNGAFDFATKPIDMEDLSRTIEKAIEQINFVHESQKAYSQLESLKKDLTTAREIQQYILPQVFPPFPEDSDKLDIRKVERLRPKHQRRKGSLSVFPNNVVSTISSALTTIALLWSLPTSVARVFLLPCSWQSAGR